MYSGGFYPFNSLEEYWAWWSRQIYVNRYDIEPTEVYTNLLKLVENKNYFVITTNVDHQFQITGFDKKRLFYTQGDYGLWQCSKPCHNKTYDNEEQVRNMVNQQVDMKIPTELVPYCPICGAPMNMNLRCDDSFVQDEGWYKAEQRYEDFIRRSKNMNVVPGLFCRICEVEKFYSLIYKNFIFPNSIYKTMELCIIQVSVFGDFKGGSMKLKNILIVVKDIEKSKQFYHDLFGLDTVLDNDGNMILTEGLVLQEEKSGRNSLKKKLFQRAIPANCILKSVR